MIFDINAIEKIAEDHPALARAAEMAVYALIVYIFTAIAAGEALNIPAAAAAISVPILAFIGKRQRDLN